MNAIILGAGLGTRLRPLTNNRPKCMVQVCGEPIIERQIRFLKQKGIDDITIVSGYMYNSLFYLKDKYGVEIVYNDRYDKANNIYSMFLVCDRFGDSYVIEGDIYMRNNIFDCQVRESTYFAAKRRYTDEWSLQVDDYNILKGINIADSGDGYIMSGVSYWTVADADIIKTRIRQLIMIGAYTDLFWDNAVIDVLDSLSQIKVRELKGTYEIDTVDDLKRVEQIMVS